MSATIPCTFEHDNRRELKRFARLECVPPRRGSVLRGELSRPPFSRALGRLGVSGNPACRVRRGGLRGLLVTVQMPASGDIMDIYFQSSRREGHRCSIESKLGAKRDCLRLDKLDLRYRGDFKEFVAPVRRLKAPTLRCSVVNPWFIPPHLYLRLFLGFARGRGRVLSGFSRGIDLLNRRLQE